MTAQFQLDLVLYDGDLSVNDQIIGCRLDPVTAEHLFLELGHRNLAERELGEGAEAFRGGMLEGVTAEAAKTLRETGAFPGAAAGDLRVPQYDAAGSLVNWRLWPAATLANPQPKTLTPQQKAGWPTAGVVWADSKGRAVLWGFGEEVTTLIVTQGEPDALTATATITGAEWAGVLGLCEEAAWSHELGQRVKQWAQAGEDRMVIIATDRDAAGERYAATVRASLGAGVSVARLRIYHKSGRWRRIWMS